MQNNDRIAQILISAGLLLFLIGLLSGFATPEMTNPRMGLAAHLEGVMNGMFLAVVGLVWSRVSLSNRLSTLTFWSLLYGTFANWFFISLAAIFGTIAMTPIAGAGHAGTPWQENLIAAGLMSVGLSMVLGCALLVLGLFRRLSAPRQ
jgi:hydroxylaminobenzene mutase